MAKNTTEIFKRSQRRLNTKWTENALRSVGIISKQVLSDLAPNISEVSETAMDTSRNIYNDLVRNRNGLNRVSQALDNNKYVKTARSAYKNAINQLKTGKLADEDAMNNALFGDSGGTSFGDEDTGGDTYNINEGPSAAALNNVGEQINKSAVAQLQFAKANMDAMISINSAAMQQRGEISSNILGKLDNINANLATIAKFNQDNMSRYIEASLAYYEKTGARIASDSDDEDEKITPDKVINGGRGGLNLDAYKKHIKQSFKKAVEGTQVGAVLASMPDALLDAFAANPIGTIAPMLVTAVLPKSVKDTIEAAEETFKNMVPSLLMELTKWGEGGDNSLLGQVRQILGKTFGIKVKDRNDDRNLAAAKVNRDAIPFDNETKHAITEIITKELREQTSYLKVLSEHLVGAGAHTRARGHQQVFDYEQNRYISVNDIDKNIAKAVADAITSGFSDTLFGKSFQNISDTLTSNAYERAYEANKSLGEKEASKRATQASESYGKEAERIINQFYNEINKWENADIDEVDARKILNSIDATTDEGKAVKRALANGMERFSKNKFNSLKAGRISAGERRSEAINEIRNNASNYHLYDSKFNNANMTLAETDEYIESLLGYRYNIDPEELKKASKERHKNEEANLYNAFKVGVDPRLVKLTGGNATLDKAGDKLKEASQGVQGMVSKAASIFNTGLNGWIETLFGRKTKSDGTLESDEEMRDRVKKDIGDNKETLKVGAGLGASLGIITGTIMNPLLGAAVGAATALGVKSERFQNWLFGEVGENDEKVGGFIPAPIQKFFKDHKFDIAAGSALGAGAGMLGLIAGGPLFGGLLGMTAGIVKNTGMFERFLYGDKDTGLPGFFTGIADAFKKHAGDGALTQDAKTLGMAGIGAVTGAALAKFGILGGALMPFGPIGGAVLGLAAGITGSGQSFREYLFGGAEETWTDSNGATKTTKSRGLVGRISGVVETEILMPLKTKLTESVSKLFVSIEDHLLMPIKFVSIFIAKNIGKFFKNTANFITESIKKMVTFPIKVMGKLFEPLSNLLGNAGKMLITRFIDIPRALLDVAGGSVLGLIGKLDPELGKLIDRQQKKSAQTRKAIKEQGKINRQHDKNAREIRKLTKGLYSDDTEEAREYIRAHDPIAYENLFGRNRSAKQVEARDTIAKAAKNAEILNMSNKQLLERSPEIYYMRQIYDFMVARAKYEDEQEGREGFNADDDIHETEFQRQRRVTNERYERDEKAIEQAFENGDYDNEGLAKFAPGFMKRALAKRHKERLLKKLDKENRRKNDILDAWMLSDEFDQSSINTRLDSDDYERYGLFGNKIRIKKQHRASGGKVTDPNGEFTLYNDKEAAISPKGTVWYNDKYPMPVRLVDIQHDAKEVIDNAADIANDTAEETKSRIEKAKEAGLDLGEQKEAAKEAEEKTFREKMLGFFGNISGRDAQGKDAKGKSVGKGVLGLLGGLASGFNSIFGIKGLVTAGLVLAAPYIIKHLPQIAEFVFKKIPTAWEKVKKVWETVNENVIQPVGGFIAEHGPAIADFVISTIPLLVETISNLASIVGGLLEKLGILETIEETLNERKKDNDRQDNIENTTGLTTNANNKSDKEAINEFTDRSLGEHVSLYNKDGVYKPNASAIANVGAHLVTGQYHRAVANYIVKKGLPGASLINVNRARSGVKMAIDTAKATGNNGVVNGALGLLDDATQKVGGKVANAVLATGDDVAAAAAKKSSGLMTKVIGMITKAFDKIGCLKFVKNIFTGFTGWITKSWNSLVGKIHAILGGRVAPELISGGLINVIFVTAGAIDGLTSASKLFHVDPEYVDNTMRVIATAFGGFKGTTVGSIIDLLTSTYYAVTQTDIMHDLAVGWYKAIKKDDDEALKKLDEGLDDFDKQYIEYQNQELEKQYNEKIANGELDPSITLEEFRKGVQDGKYEIKYMSRAEFNTDKHKSLSDHILTTVTHPLQSLGKVGKFLGDGAKGIGDAALNFGKDMVAGAKWGIDKVTKFGKDANRKLKNMGLDPAAIAIAGATGPVGMLGLAGMKLTNLIYDKFGQKSEATVYRPMDNPLTYYRADKGGKTFTLYNDNGDIIAEEVVSAEQMLEMQKQNLVKEDTVELDSRNASFLDQVKGIGASLKEAAGNIIDKLKTGAATLKDDILKKAGGVLGDLATKGKDLAKKAGGFLLNLAKNYTTPGIAINLAYKLVGDKKKVTIYRPIDQPLCYYMQDSDGKTYSLYNSNGDIVDEKCLTNDELRELLSNSLVTTDSKEVADKEVSTTDKIKGILTGVREKLSTTWKNVAEAASKNMEGLKNALSGLTGGLLFGTKNGGSGGGFGDILNGSTYYSQNDPRWAGKKYNTGRDDATMSNTGCGPSAVAMAMSDVTGKQITPMQMANLAKMTGNRDATGTNWNFVNTAAMANGIPTKEVRNPDGRYIQNQLINGKKVVLSGTSENNGPYTKAGHYIVAEGLDRNGNVIVNDPRGKSYSKKYDANQLARQTGSSWAMGGGRGPLIETPDAGPNLLQMAESRDLPHGTPITTATTAITDTTDTQVKAYSDFANRAAALGYPEDTVKATIAALSRNDNMNTGSRQAALDLYYKVLDGIRPDGTKDTSLGYYIADQAQQDEHEAAMLDADGAVIKDYDRSKDASLVDTSSESTETIGPNEEWLATVQEVKKAMAESGSVYDKSGSVTITANGKTIKMRTDCSGFVSACLVAFGTFPDNYKADSTVFASSSCPHMADHDWTYLNWPDWDGLIPGDIIARNGHVEIFAGNEGNAHKVYNAGTTKAIQTPGPTNSSKTSYTAVWRPKGSVISGKSSSSTSSSTTNATSKNATKASGGDFWSKITAGLSAIAGEFVNRLVVGDYDKKDFTDVWRKAIYGEEDEESSSTSSSSSSSETSENGGDATVSSSGSTSGGAANIPGSNEKEKIWNYLVSKGFTKNAAAGVMGCWEAESSNKPARVEGDFAQFFPGYENVKTKQQLNDYTVNKLFANYDRKGTKFSKSGYIDKASGLYLPGLGLAQWTGDRAGRLLDYSEGKSGGWQDLGNQLDYFLNAPGEFTSRTGLMEQLNSVSNPEDAATIFLDGFEMSKGFSTRDATGRKYNAARRANALAIYNMYKDLTAKKIESQADQDEHEAVMLDADGAVIKSNANTNTKANTKVKTEDDYATMVDADGAVIKSNANTNTKAKSEDDYAAMVDADGRYIGGKGGGFGNGIRQAYKPSISGRRIGGGRGPQIITNRGLNTTANQTRNVTNVKNVGINASNITPEQVAEIIALLSQIAQSTGSSNSKLDMLKDIGGTNMIVAKGGGGSGKIDPNTLRSPMYSHNDRNSQVAQNIARGGIN